MSNLPSHRAFFGDREHVFALPPAMVLELEAVLNCGVGGLFRRLAQSDFRHKEITETIRLGLIGGGEKPETAARLVETYVPATGLIESYSLALGILETLMFAKVQTVEDAIMNEDAVMSAVLRGEGA